MSSQTIAMIICFIIGGVNQHFGIGWIDSGPSFRINVKGAIITSLMCIFASVLCSVVFPN